MSPPFEFGPAMMRRALELARQGRGRVEPNPAVGAVIADDAGTILGEGWHREYGGPHAEVHALAVAGERARGANLFVTLEPCCHFGKTPPCTKAVIAAGIRRVFVAMRDPAPHVDGGGILELREAGIDVEVGLEECDAQRLVAPFVQLMTKARSWFHAKWAMTLDGKIASTTGHSQWISNSASRAVVHGLRGRMDAVLIGIGTALADDPLLTARPAGPRLATRIVIDSSARLPLASRLVQTVSQSPVLVITSPQASAEQRESLRARGVDVVEVDTDTSGRPALAAIAHELGRRRMTNVLVEGGSAVLGAFFDAELIDEVHAFIAPKLVGGAGAFTPIAGRGIEIIPQTASLEGHTCEMLDGDLYINGRMSRTRASRE